LDTHINGHLFWGCLWWHSMCQIIILEESLTGISKACCKIDSLWQIHRPCALVRIPKLRRQTLMSRGADRLFAYHESHFGKLVVTRSASALAPPFTGQGLRHSASCILQVERRYALAMVTTSRWGN